VPKTKTPQAKHERPAPAEADRVTDPRARAVIDAVRPSVDRGRFPAKRIVGERVRIEADIIADGHDQLGCVLLHRQGEGEWTEQRMRASYNDLWLADFQPDAVGPWSFKVRAWVDPFITWAHDLARRVEAGQDIGTDLEIGAAIVEDTAKHGRDLSAKATKALQEWAERLRGDESQAERARAAMGDELEELMWAHTPRRFADESAEMPLWVERPLARCSAWYEMFPRSASTEPGKHGTLRDVIAHLDYVDEMGFDILYLPPIHPIGETARKGKNNAQTAEPGDVGSPWAVGGKEGGHKAIHPDLGDFKDFEALVKEAKKRGIEVALDIAFQCAPDHPYVKDHPEWFKHRPDGTIQYAENPPKKYQDIYPFDFECADAEALWEELKSVFSFWIEKGVTVFRVDNPHTKPFIFWDWVIGEIQRDHPEVMFLSEAFTRPKKMYRLAKGGFTQSYTYFAWRNGPADLREYLEEISKPPVSDFMRPSFWPNTPDILTDYLRDGGRPAAMARLTLAATLSPSYGIYGPVYELCDFAQRPGSEENLDNEKYELRHWDREDRWSLRHYIGVINRIRREHPALHELTTIRFHDTDNPAHVAYSKRDPTGRDTILCVVNTNPSQEQWGIVRLDLEAIGQTHDAAFVAHDLLTGVRHRWHGADQTIGLEPGAAHVFHIEDTDKGEQGFETFF
jgi:starch synthase (maltosyl-transferring)